MDAAITNESHTLKYALAAAILRVCLVSFQSVSFSMKNEAFWSRNNRSTALNAWAYNERRVKKNSLKPTGR